jgi:hypothetical protein
MSNKSKSNNLANESLGTSNTKLLSNIQEDSAFSFSGKSTLNVINNIESDNSHFPSFFEKFE